MANIQGSFTYGDMYQVSAAAPLDVRTVVETVDDLTAKNSWNEETHRPYKGMVVSVEETGDLYILIDETKVHEESSWKKQSAIDWEFVNEPDVKDANTENFYVGTYQQNLTGPQKENAIRNLGLNEYINALDDKQNWISDLETIREGAKKGATALQSVPEEYATTEYVDKAVAQGGSGGGAYNDAEIRSELKRIDGEVVELSTEVGKRNIGAVDPDESVEEPEIPSGESSVFEAVYGETTYEEIIAAAKAQKHVMCFYENRVYNLNNFGEGLDLTFSCAGGVLRLVTCTTQSKWSNSKSYLETISYKVQSLSDKSTTDQYPSAKAVYDFVNNTLGTIINGDY